MLSQAIDQLTALLNNAEFMASLCHFTPAQMKASSFTSTMKSRSSNATAENNTCHWSDLDCVYFVVHALRFVLEKNRVMQSGVNAQIANADSCDSSSHSLLGSNSSAFSEESNISLKMCKYREKSGVLISLHNGHSGWPSVHEIASLRRLINSALSLPTIPTR
jgi:hypothetical protein